MIKITITTDTPEELIAVLSGISRKAEKPFQLTEIEKHKLPRVYGPIDGYICGQRSFRLPETWGQLK